MRPEEWPVILTNQNWQKKKGPFAKATGETGIGRLMIGAKKQYDYVPWKELIRPTARQFKSRQITGADIARVKKDMHDRCEDFLPDAITLLLRVEESAKEQSAKWKRSKVIPAGAARHADDVAAAAANFALLLRPTGSVMPKYLDRYDAALDAMQNA